MSTEKQFSEQEIDIFQLVSNFKNFLEAVKDSIFFGILFIKKNILIIITLVVVGFGFGFYLDEKSSYEQQIIVSPNLGSAEYLYSQVSLLNSKIKEKDFNFLTQTVGIKNAECIKKISIKPIVDIYKFTTDNSLQNNGMSPVAISKASDKNTEIIKILSEKYDIKDMLSDSITSKNYPYHKIEFLTNTKIRQEEIITPVLNYLNKIDYFENIKKQRIENLKFEIQTSDSIVKQIDGVIKSFQNKSSNSSKEINLLFNNENLYLDKMIKIKDSIVVQQGIKKINLLQLDKVIRDNGITINKKSTKGINNKSRYVLALTFVFLYLFIKLFISFYSSRKLKHQLK